MYTNLLTNSIEVLKFLVIFNLIFHRRIKEKTGKYTGLIVLVGLLVLMSYVLHSDDQIVAIIVFGVELFLIYSDIVWNKILLFLITIVATNYLDSFLLAIGSYAIKGKIWWYFIYDDFKIALLENVISFFIIMIIALICKKKMPSKDYLGRKITFAMCIMLLGATLGLYILFIVMMMFMTYGGPDNRARLYGVIYFASVITVACIIAFFIYSNRLKHQNDVHIETEGLYGESLGLKLAYGEQVHDDYEKVRQFRHDFRHHIAAMEGLVYGGEYSELEKYMGQLSQKDKELNRERVRYTGNFMVDSIIFGITRDQKFKDVDFQFDGGLPSNLGVKDIDICGVLANALENAMEACLKGNDRKAVIMKAGCYENMISFQIKNTYDSSRYKALAGGEFYSSKEGDGHGYGIQNMERVVKSYNGKMEYNVDPEWVTVDIFLQQKDEI